MGIPLGFVYIAGRLPRLVPPLVLVYASSRIWIIAFKTPAPLWLRISVYMLSIPFVMTCSVLYTYICDRREAARRGAVLAPRVKSIWPGGLDTILSVMRTFRNVHIRAPFDQYCQEYGPVVNVRIMFEDQIMMTEPEHIKAILVTQFNSFEKGYALNQVSTLLGTGVFNSDGEIWKFHRSMTRPFFSKNRISHFDIFEKHVEDVLSQAKVRLREGYPVDFQDMVYRFTLDSATEFLFGKSVQSISAGLVYPKNSVPGKNNDHTNHLSNIFACAFSDAQSHTALRGRLGTFWRVAEFWSDRVKKEMEVCYKFIDPILKDALETKRSTKGGEHLEDTLLGVLINCTEGKRSIPDLTVIRDEIVNILIAGRDTTATTLTFLIYMLSQHQNILKWLRAEVLSMVGSSRRPTNDDVLNFRDQCISGVCLTCFLLCRTSTEAVVWTGIKGGSPIYIPPNTRIPYSVYLMHRGKDLWGPDADIFDLDRFLDERSKYLTSNPFIFLLFNAGPRICLGQEASDFLFFAYNKMTLFLVCLLQNFSSITLAEDVQTQPPVEWGKRAGCNPREKVVIRHHLTLYVDDSLWVQMGEPDPSDNM
ncbi:cytochrome P450 [Pisolithus marmoratus]|nr:cytochrome P450 [Pisolithus marmoratus]